ncbi:polysaccharide deacetylase family protein [Phenylobacterium sp.]|uniref:polysaccharide deacetylase family protein n=1 Tax=Phenylobacterium sp. TaxID=1871053 RepID=UPI00374D5E45
MPEFLIDRFRNGLSPSARTTLRRLADRFFSGVGSINGARNPTDHVAITFDDGPDPEVTPRLLDMLKARECRATFFILSDKAAADPSVVRRMVAEGHEIALHSDRHDRLTTMPLRVVRERLIAARRRLEAIAGPIRFFRPPFGGQSFGTYFVARRLGLDVVTWGPHAEDWVEQPPADAAARALNTMRGGDILLLHDGMEMAAGELAPKLDRVRVTELVLDGMADRGLIPTTVGDLVSRGQPRMSPWFRY